MRDKLFLVMTKKGVQRMSKRPPKLAGNERSVEIMVNVDDSIFEYTFMKTELNIKEEDVLEPTLEVQVMHANEKL